jgi:hypothetical protein
MQANTDGQSAYTIKKMYSAVKEKLEEVRAEYKKEVSDLYATKDENGEYTLETFKCVEGKEEELKKRNYNTVFTINDLKEASMIYQGMSYFKGMKVEEVSVCNISIISGTGQLCSRAYRRQSMLLYFAAYLQVDSSQGQPCS